MSENCTHESSITLESYQGFHVLRCTWGCGKDLIVLDIGNSTVKTFEPAEIAEHDAALKRIVRATNEWDANKLGGVHVQRKRWQRCREIAAAALKVVEQ